MSENQVTRVNTPVPILPWTLAAIEAWHSLFGSYPSQKSLAVLYGQFMVETSGTAVWNYNLGNVKHVPGDGHDYVRLETQEENPDGTRYTIVAEFIALDSLSTGMRFYMTLLHDKRYKPAWPYVESGDPQGFVHAIKQLHYFTASEESYNALVANGYNKYMNSSAYATAIAQLGASEGKDESSADSSGLPAGSSDSESTNSPNESNFDIHDALGGDVVHKSPIDEES